LAKRIEVFTAKFQVEAFWVQSSCGVCILHFRASQPRSPKFEWTLWLQNQKIRNCKYIWLS